MDRKTYMKDVYWQYWISARDKKYGFLEYDRNLCDYISSNIPQGATLLEVAVGTGYPFAAFFSAAGYAVHGVDISPQLIQECQKLFPSISCKVGDVENLDYPNGYFDATYCFHSTWYFPDLKRAIDEMLRVTRQDGLVIFDIQNRNNHSIEKNYQKCISETKGIYRVQRYFKNIARIVLRRRPVDWHFVVHEVPVRPEEVYKHLAARQIKTFKVFARMGNGSLDLQDELGSFVWYPRLVIVVWK